MRGDLFEVVVGIDAGLMAIGKVELESVTADLLPARHLDAAEVFILLISRDGISKKVSLALGFGAGREGAEAVHFIKVVGTIRPADGYFVSDDLDVAEPCHS